MAGSGLLRPQARPRTEKLVPASAKDQCISPIIGRRTNPSEMKVAKLTKKNGRQATPKTSHLSASQLFRAAPLTWSRPHQKGLSPNIWTRYPDRVCGK